jgi:hypothetical protein
VVTRKYLRTIHRTGARTGTGRIGFAWSRIHIKVDWRPKGWNETEHQAREGNVYLEKLLHAASELGKARKRVMPAARAKISAAAKRRWAKVRAGARKAAS